MTTSQLQQLLALTHKQATIINRRVVTFYDTPEVFGYSIEGLPPVTTSQAIRSLTLFA